MPATTQVPILLMPRSAKPGSPSATSTEGALSSEHLGELREAKALLEHPGIAARLADMVGSPIEKGMKMLPARWQKTVHSATEAALMKAADVAVSSLGKGGSTLLRDRMH